MTAKTAFPPMISPRALVQRVPRPAWLTLAALATYAIISHYILAAYPEAEPRLRFTIEPVLTASVAVQIHIASALSAFVIGVILMLAPKGVRLHKTLGWAWVVAMTITAVSSFFITGLMGSSLSPIHALSAWTMIGLPFGIAAIRRRNIREHRQSMTGMFVGAILVAGLFSFLPGRLMWKIFFAV